MITDTMGYKKSGIKLETVYTIEFLDNKPDAERVFSGRCGAPWELYKKKKITDLTEAISFFVNMYSRLDNDGYAKIYDVKMFEEIKLNDELIQERIITDIYNIGAIAGQESQKIRKQNEALSETIEYQKSELETMNSFIKYYHAEQTYKNFKTTQEQAS